MKYIKCMSVDEYVEEYGDECIDIGVEWIYVGVYDDGEDYEESSIAGWVFEDGMCEIVGCGMDRKCSFDEMILMLKNEIKNIEKCYK